MRALFQYFLSWFPRIGTLRHRRPAVLAITPCYMEQLALRIVSSNQQWNLLISPTFESAMYTRSRSPVAVIIYDIDVPDIDWRQGIHAFLSMGEPVCVIAVSSYIDDALWQEALECGAFDLQRKPLKDNRGLAHAVAEAQALIASQALREFTSQPSEKPGHKFLNLLFFLFRPVYCFIPVGLYSSTMYNQAVNAATY